MILRVSAAPLLDEEHARFILLPGISMTASSRAAGNRAELGRVHGVRVAGDRRRVTVLLPGDQYPDLIDALRAQAKGADASEVLGADVNWEKMFAALLSLLLKKHLITDWEFVRELKR